MINKKDITIIFFVYKSYLWSKLAINSFILKNPDYKDRIVIFNDNFSSIDMFGKDNFKIITWKNYKRNSDTLIRVAQMYQDATLQCNTKFILFVDNDTISLQDNFVNEMLYNVDKYDYKIYAPYTCVSSR